ncbi:T-cell ecto-ADP-ribosyltransferase 1 [Notolabrus celidotus]|uniref:T-cell ecto-ADP-ribosyltransferase 1 n=1 Tax=Notolabrus celidotus TaxID=1203425 RepID=UPI0014907313|nr:T-cell ecto-ADP-ribosyltransferase 1 [Notolabrus celidotus]
MWETKKLPLAVIVFTVSFYKVTSGSTELMDMAPDAVDDLYNGCSEKAMKKFIESGMLTQELDQNEGVKKAWNENNKCSKLIPGGIKEHTTALSAMANGDPDSKKAFNNAVKTMGTNESTYENFNFKSLHFLLIDSMKLVQNQNAKQCKTVYYLSEGICTTQLKSKVRLGGFTIAFKSYGVLKEFEDWNGRTIFNITTCFFFNLDENVCSQDEDMVLLSPVEVFTVKSEKKVVDRINEDSYTQIVLEQPELGNSHNCYIFSRSPADVSALWLVLVLVVYLLFGSLKLMKEPFKIPCCSETY